MGGVLDDQVSLDVQSGHRQQHALPRFVVANPAEQGCAPTSAGDRRNRVELGARYVD
jgi:hypothetical protein